MRLFELRRNEDESGVSGTGIVAQGVIFDNGWCALTWLTDHTSVAFYTSIYEVIAIHGHGGKTKVVQFADIDQGTVSGLVANAYQDDCENIGPVDEYLWEQRQKFADLFRHQELVDDRDGGDVLREVTS